MRRRRDATRGISTRAGADIARAAGTGKKPYEVARLRGHLAMATWLEHITAIGWTSYLSEPRYALVVLRELAGRDRARRKRADAAEEQLLDFIFGAKAKRARPDPVRLPSDLLPLILQFYWGGTPVLPPRDP